MNYFSFALRSGAGHSDLPLQGYGPAPDLIPATVGTKEDPLAGKSMSSLDAVDVDILKSHAWTNSPPSSRVDVPRLILEEQRISINPTINQVAYNFLAGTGKATSMIDTVKSTATELKNAQDITSAAKKQAKEKLGNDHTIGKMDETSRPQKPYDFLYSTLPTGFRYTLPYFADTFRTGNLGFGTGGGEATAGALGMLGIGNLGAAVGDIVKSLNLTAPGVYIEQPKFYNFTGRESSYTVKFPLLNTGTFDDVMRNWEFLFLLTYQNMPNRISRDVIEPPVIYTAKIPGMWFSRYAAITNLSVEFKGARRMMELSVSTLTSQTGNSGVIKNTPAVKEFTTIIPDAYEVSITVTELFGETKNMAYEVLNDDFKITVNKLGGELKEVDSTREKTSAIEKTLEPDQQEKKT
jgi:hypothetical protein